jgi:hypothetical protein
MIIKILKGELIPTDKIKTGDIRAFKDQTAKNLIKKGIAEEVKYKEEPKKEAKKKAPKKK